MKPTTLLITIAVSIIVLSLKAQESGSFIDSRDGKTYKTIKIGEQLWMAENLNFNTTNGSWCHDEISENCVKYGRLYNWETAQKVCPSGWHLPSNEEWKVLSIDTLAGKKLKDSGETNYFSGEEDDYMIGSWWTSTEEVPNYASKYWFLTKENFMLNNHSNLIGNKDGLSIRCVKD